MNLKEIVEQLESCGYECEGGSLENNVAFQELKKMADQCPTLEPFNFVPVADLLKPPVRKADNE